MASVVLLAVFLFIDLALRAPSFADLFRICGCVAAGALL